jgi:methylenetetrahydrofolate dehydrogenase (NADP+)/methenyltetrahydrofolate cyclohydrolase
MTARIIDGRAFAAGILVEIKAETAALAASGLVPGLAVVLLGEDPASQVYVRNKARTTKEVGMASFEHRLAADTSEAALLALVAELNALPRHIDSARVLDAISPDKDVDGFHVINAGRLAAGLPGLVPCTPLGCLLMLKAELGDLSGARAVVLGRSNIVGKPMAALLLRESCTVTIAHSRTRDLAEECRRADILVAAVGQPEMVRGDWIKPGATVLDVGINRIAIADNKTRLVGDVAFAEALEVAGRITPVPGGVGPMTIACLLRNTLTAATRLRSV